MKRSQLLASTAIALVLSAQSLSAEEAKLPAVSGVNAKFGAAFGAINGEATGVAEGSVSFPVGRKFGVQIDGLAGGAEKGGLFGGGAHLFWRDPAKGLFGAYAGVVKSKLGGVDKTVYAIGAEGSLYLDRITVDVFAGFVDGDEVDENFGAIWSLGYYPIDDLRLSVGGRYLDGDFAGIGKAEYLVGEYGSSSVAIFGRGLAGEDDEWQALVGVRLYFGGEKKSLIRRHREDDPSNLSLDFLFESKIDAPAAAPTPAPEPTPPPPTTTSAPPTSLL